jgi:hypothetical protein
MRDFNFEPTSTAEWHALVLEAQAQAGYQFEESIESYLVLTLDQYTQQSGIASIIIATELMEGIQQTGLQGNNHLRRVGDQCLILSGLFPERAIKKNVSLAYIIGMGKNAYSSIAANPDQIQIDGELFYKLSENFIGCMDVLNAMRQLPFYITNIQQK